MRFLNSTQVRALYEQTLGIILPKGYEVHHIDLDPNNNSIENLVALPISVHRDYHKALSSLTGKGLTFTIGLKPIGINEAGARHFEFSLDALNEYSKAHFEVVKFMKFRDYKLGLIPESAIKGY